LDRTACKLVFISLLAAAVSLFGFPQFPARLPRFIVNPADFNGFGPASGRSVSVFPDTREFSASLAFAAA